MSLAIVYTAVRSSVQWLPVNKKQLASSQQAERI
jgi:hypothetical protein